MSKFLLVEPEQLMRQALAGWLREQPDVTSVMDVGAADAAAEYLRTQRPDIVIMEWNLPNVAGLEVVERWRRQFPQTAIIVLTRYTDDPFPRRLLDAGVMGLVSKFSPLDELAQAVRLVRRGQHHIGNDIAQRLAYAGFRSADRSPFEDLSNRELQVMMMFTEGLSVQDISTRLCVSPKTVSTYRYRMFDKLGVRGEAELTRMAYRYGILDNQSGSTVRATSTREASRH